jgi:Ca-activated chloride channel family protein
MARKKDRTDSPIDQFIGLVDESLSPHEAEELRRKIDIDPNLRSEFEQYRRIVAGERRVHSVTGEPSADFLEQVMTNVRNEPDEGMKLTQWEMVVMQYKKYRNVVVGAIATGGVVCLALLLPEGEVGSGDQALRSSGSGYSPVAKYNDDRVAAAAPPADASSFIGDAVTAFHDTETQAVKGGDKTNDVGQNASLGGSSTSAVGRPMPPAKEEGMTGSVSRFNKGRALVLNDLLAERLYQYEEKSGTVLKQMIDKSSDALAGAPSTDSAHPTVAQRITPPHQPITQPFQLTTTAPHSTFSMDVDTGSYTNTRKILRSGRRPSVDLVRAEEFINYFSYQHPTNTEKPFSTVYDIAPSPMTKGAKILRIGVKSRESISSDKPWNLVFLIDTSGSMADHNKLPMVKEALKLLAGKMRASDRLSIVTYANGSQVALPPTRSGELDRINGVIDGLTAEGGTNGHAGITLAYQAAQQGFIPNGVNRVILATDGDFNVGITNHDELITEIQRQRLKNVSLTTVGVGEANYQEHLMEQLADKGDGNYFYLDTFDEARKVFGHDLISTIDTVAKDAKIQVEFNPAAVSQYRLIGYENRALAAHQFTDNSVDAGEVGAGQSVTALYEVVLAGDKVTQEGTVETRYGPTPAPTPTPGPRPEEFGFVRIRFQDPTSKEVEQLSFPMMTEQVQSSLAESSENLRFATAVAAFAEKLCGVAINATYAEIADLAQGARGSDPDGRRAEFISLVREAEAMP